MKASLIVLGILWGIAFPGVRAHAEGGCPPGMWPFQFAPNHPRSCVPMQSGGQQQLPEIWSDRSGAIALDWSHDILSGVTDMKNERAARAAALDDCQAKGGTRCEIEQSYTNGCAAVTLGEPNRFNSSVAATRERVIAIGMDTCIGAGSKDCRIFYSACSFPVRIQ